jgi:ADP-heptose:LPS heptosyltransferase
VALDRPLLIVLRALGLGDLLTAAPALRGLARAFPDHRRVLATPSVLAPLAALITVDGRRAVSAVADSRPLRPLPGTLHDADVAVNLHGRGPQSHRLLLAARPGSLIAFANDEAGVDGPRWRPGEHEVERWCRLLTENGIPADPRELEIDRPHARPPEAAYGATVIHPGAASPARRWPVARFAAVAHAEYEAGRSVVITGSAAERPLAQAVAHLAGLPRASVLAGTTDLECLAALIAVAGRVVSGDTGVAHLATALDVPSLVLFGPTPPSEWGPFDQSRHRVLWKGTRGDPHAEGTDAGLLAIGEDQVLEELAALPGREGVAR